MPDRLEEIGAKILAWYKANRRDLPWRKTKDPYKIWISEIMLQQTRVDTVMGYYHRFLERFPDIAALARAEEDEVLTVWQGLGYYSRARNLHRAAGLMVSQYGGRFPDTYEEVRKLPGVGDYTAAAVLSIAFERPHAAVDGNVLRVVSRLEELEEDITRAVTKRKVSAIVTRMIPKQDAGDFTQAMMEHGALVCIPVQPLCAECPVQCFCAAYASGRQNELPVKKKAGTVKEFHMQVAVVREQGRILLEHRREETLLAGMWGLPLVEAGSRSSEELFYEKYGLKLSHRRNLGSATHVFTHQIWKMEAVFYKLQEESSFSPVLYWAEESKLENYAIPTAFKRVLRLL